MRKVVIILLVVISTSSLSFAQNVRYKIKKDDPMDCKNLIIHLDPNFSDVYFTDLALGYAVRADWLMNKVMDVSIEWRKPYFDMNWMDVKDFKLKGEQGSGSEKDYMPKNGFSQYTYLEPTFRLHFADKVKQGNHRLILSQSSYTSGNYRYTNSKFIDVPGKIRKIKSLEAGIIWLDAPILYSGTFSDKPEAFTFNPKSGGDAIPATEAFGGTMMQMMTFYGGLSFQSLSNLKALTDQYGVKYSSNWTNFYFDFMYAPVVNFVDVKDAQGAEYEVKNEDISRMGWRLGYSLKNTKGTSWSMKMNLGSRPGFNGEGGILNPRFFMDFNFGIALASKVKLLPSKKEGSGS